MASSKKKESEAPPEVVADYDRMVASCAEAVRMGTGTPHTNLNGHMYSFVHPSGAVALRLPANMREEFIAKYSTKLFDAYGLVQKEYVEVPHRLLANTDEVAPYFRASFEYVQTLKPKKKQS
jgi:hypothetical protein